MVHCKMILKNKIRMGKQMDKMAKKRIQHYQTWYGEKRKAHTRE